ncbi:MAG: tetratricopeptide repeat protein [Saprospiraceae bacterium]|nr:tetratricopeptide repeat protein [Saprospiraceae bacterium]
MVLLTRQCWIIGLTVMTCCLKFPMHAQVDSMTIMMNEVLREKAWNLRFENPDSSLYLLDLCYHRLIEQGDTSKAIGVLMNQATVSGNQANYKDSYDKLWTGLLLADQAKIESSKVMLYIRLGRYYSFYKRKDEAMRYFGLSLELNKRLVKEGIVPESNLINSYYPFCATYRELAEPELASIYLDSCFQLHTADNKPLLHFLQFEQAFILNTERKYEAALGLYHEILPWFAEFQPGYRVLLKTYMGDTYLGLNDMERAEQHYQEALQISSQYNSHKDFSPLIHQRLSDLYLERGNYLEAYNRLKAEKTLDEAYFDSRSEKNRPLLEIQDAYRAEQDRITELLQEKRMTDLEHQNSLWFLQRIILLVCILFVILISVLYFNYVRTKHRTEKQMIKRERELEIQNVNELIEIKNKELAASTLKLIEKDEFLSNLKDKLAQQNGDLNAKSVKQIVRSINSNSSQNWEEFEARFITVNQDFYQRLEDKFPKLTQGDKRLCALIKLDFSSKDMAKLMGISVESVHTNRYRLRKKLDLERDINLTEFIATL